MKQGRADIIDIAVFTALVYAATIAVQIYQPATGGYFNLGEAVIYVAALLRGPLVAAIAGGVGAALADLSTGYAIFAPATLVIKAAEGYLAGVLAVRLRRVSPRPAGILAGIGYATLIIVFGLLYWSGEAYYGPEELLGSTMPSPLVTIPVYLWIAAAAGLGAGIAYFVGRTVRGGEAAALLLAGLVMVAGYFIYEYTVSNPLTGRDPWLALAEIPVNIGQAVLGASIAIPIAGWLRKAGYMGEGGKA